jgi:hypothetical protein
MYHEAKREWYWMPKAMDVQHFRFSGDQRGQHSNSKKLVWNLVTFAYYQSDYAITIAIVIVYVELSAIAICHCHGIPMPKY